MLKYLYMQPEQTVHEAPPEPVEAPPTDPMLTSSPSQAPQPATVPTPALDQTSPEEIKKSPEPKAQVKLQKSEAKGDSNVRLAIIATVIIVLVISALAVYAYTKNK
jgi:hypothetical protein